MLIRLRDDPQTATYSNSRKLLVICHLLHSDSERVLSSHVWAQRGPHSHHRFHGLQSGSPFPRRLHVSLMWNLECNCTCVRTNDLKDRMEDRKLKKKSKNKKAMKKCILFAVSRLLLWKNCEPYYILLIVTLLLLLFLLLPHMLWTCGFVELSSCFIVILSSFYIYKSLFRASVLTSFFDIVRRVFRMKYVLSPTNVLNRYENRSTI